MKCGVSQGAVLGPLLLIIYVNVLPNVSKKSIFCQVVAQEKNAGGLVLPKCRWLAVSKNFIGQNLLHWLKKLKRKGHGYYESADSA